MANEKRLFEEAMKMSEKYADLDRDNDAPRRRCHRTRRPEWRVEVVVRPAEGGAVKWWARFSPTDPRRWEWAELPSLSGWAEPIPEGAGKGWSVYISEFSYGGFGYRSTNIDGANGSEVLSALTAIAARVLPPSPAARELKALIESLADDITSEGLAEARGILLIP